MIRLSCAACGAFFTRECRWGTMADLDAEAADRTPVVSSGIMVRLTDHDAVPVMQFGKVVRIHVYSPVGAISINPADLLPASLTTAGIDNGCCGSDGCNGPNRACRKCGTVVATEWSDCWTQAEVRFLPEAVVIDGH